jgi:hypothetical protein
LTASWRHIIIITKQFVLTIWCKRGKYSWWKQSSVFPFILQINCKSMKHSTVATSGRGTSHTCMRDGAFKNKLCIVADFAELQLWIWRQTLVTDETCYIMIALEFTFNTFSNDWKRKKKEIQNMLTYLLILFYTLTCYFPREKCFEFEGNMLMDFVKWRPVFTFYAAENCHMMSRLFLSAKVIDNFSRRFCRKWIKKKSPTFIWTVYFFFVLQWFA